MTMMVVMMTVVVMMMAVDRRIRERRWTRYPRCRDENPRSRGERSRRRSGCRGICRKSAKGDGQDGDAGGQGMEEEFVHDDVRSFVGSVCCL